MAEEVLYASAGGEPNKRKYEDSPSPVARRATGFSTAPDSGAPPSLYASVPPPMSEIELAKQKAQEIAARLVSNADPSKRARVENGGNGVGGYDSSDYGSQKPMGMGFSAPPQVASSGYPGPSKKIEIPNGRVGVIIGKGGETIKYLQLQSGAKIQVTRDMDADPNSSTRGVDLMGTPDQIAKAEQLIHEVLSEAEAGGSGSGTRRMTGQSSGAEQFEMKVPNNKVGLVIGKGGETIKNMQARTGARIQVIPLHLPPGDMSQERTVQIDGTSEQIEAAKQLVYEVISENRMRNSTSSGGYSQQGYQTRPPTNWGQPGPPMQQPGYSYSQPGAYPSPSPQYNMNQPPYSGYPSQTGAGGYSAGWDQSSAAAQNQQGGAYDYYNQQQQQPAGGGTAASTDASGYGYSQAPAAYSQGQGYSQESYAAYYANAAQSGYTQPQQNTSTGYDQQQQQQQGYNSAYGNASNPTADGHTASYGTQGEANQAPASGQSYNAGGQPVANPSYPPQASQPGYGAQGGYGAPPQAQKPPSGHPPSGQVGYAQTESGYQRPPSAGYATSQPGYGAPPAATQAGYGQQQPNPYGGSYGGGGYAQPSAYPSDGATYEAAAPPQSAQQSGSAKASPPPS